MGWGREAPALEKSEIAKVGIVEKTGQVVSPDLHFVDENGREVKFGQYFDGRKPVVLVLSYYGCPALCTLVLNHVVGTAAKLKGLAGRDFNFVTVSIDPREKPGLAKDKQKAYLGLYGRSVDASGFAFLTSPDNAVAKLAEQVGFGYVFDPDANDYVHTAVVFILGPHGEVFRYLYGTGYQVNDLNFALLEANPAQADLLERLLHWFYRYDALSKRYEPAGLKVLLVLSGLFIGVTVVFWRMTKQRGKSC